MNFDIFIDFLNIKIKKKLVSKSVFVRWKSILQKSIFKANKKEINLSQMNFEMRLKKKQKIIKN